MTRYMLDTNVVSDMMRNPAGRVAARIAEVGEGRVCLSIITAAELCYGAARSSSSRLQERVHAVLACMPILAFDRPADTHYGAIRSELQAAGRPIGPMTC